MEQKIDLKQIEGVLDELAKVKGSLITILQKTQETYGTEKSVGKIYMEMFSEVSFLTKNQVTVKVVNSNLSFLKQV